MAEPRMVPAVMVVTSHNPSVLVRAGDVEHADARAGLGAKCAVSIGENIARYNFAAWPFAPDE
jgi:hypothetical protein